MSFLILAFKRLILSEKHEVIVLSELKGKGENVSDDAW